ncbi:MAG: glycosyltransferase family 4 protein [Ilumatobacteraceae bacterium]
MRILMLSWEYPPTSTGGMAAHVDGLAHGLQRHGHDVVVVTRRTPGTEVDSESSGLRVLRPDTDLPWLPDDPIAATASANHHLVAVTALLGDWHPDIVHAHDWGVAWAADVVGALYAVPIVTTFHGTERGRHGGHLAPGRQTDINSIEWWQSARSRRVIAATRLMITDIVDGFEMDPDHVVRIPIGIDPGWWESNDGVATTRRRGLVFTWGRVQYEKGFQVLARAIGSLRHRVEGLECTIAGRGSFLPELQSQIDIAGVGDLIEVPGFLSDHQLRQHLHEAGCVVIPSLYEPFGVVALEALAGGAPLIVADTGGLAELVGGTGAALTFEPGNAAELADRIEQVLTDTTLADRLVEAGRNLLRDSYSWDAIALRTLDVYRAARDIG